tara:strand:- start:2957 stop:3400 length:444 start_codon:yes stop_codon:yes gene_type:complete
MKKSTSTIIAFALAFFISLSINAQTTATNVKKTTESECVDKKEKECTKSNKGFSFLSKNTKSESCCKSKSNKSAQKTSCDSKAQKTSCDSKAQNASNSKAKQSSCCSKTAKASNRDAAAKVRQAIAKGEITPEQGNARLARLQKSNK